MKFNNRILNSIILAQMIWLIGCGGAMTAMSNVSNSPSGIDFGDQNPAPSIDPQLEKAESETLMAETAMMDAEKAIDSLWKNGQIVVEGGSQAYSATGLDESLYTSGSIQSKSLTGLPEKLEAKLDQIYLKITAPVRLARSKIAEARVQIVLVMSQLDPTLPGYDQIKGRLQGMLDRLDQLDSRISTVFQRLAAKAQDLLNKVDVLISGTSLGSNPLLWIALWELREVRDVVQEFINKLSQV